MEKYILEKSKELTDWWVLTDTLNLVVIRFKEHEFNETQKVSFLDEEKVLKEKTPNEIAHILSEMGDYMFRCWYSIAMPTPVFELREDEEKDRMLLIRHKYPKFTVEIQDECDVNNLANALRKSAEFLLKRRRK